MKIFKLIICLIMINVGTLMANNEQPIDSSSIADSLMEVFQFEKAKEIWYDIHRSYSRNPNVLYKLGICHLNMGNYSDAIIYLNESYKEDSTQVAVLLQLAVAFNKTGQYDQAINSYEKLVGLDPENGYYHRLTAGAFIAAKDPVKAVSHLNIAITMNDMDMEGYQILSKLYFNNGDFDKALEVASAGLHKNIRNVDLLFMSARVLFLKKKYEQVITLGNNAVKINSDTSRWNLYLGYSNYYLDRYADCILWLNTAIQDKSITEQGLTYLANSYLKTGNKNKAQTYLDKAIAMAKDDNLETNLQNKAILLYEEAKEQEAIKLLEEAYHINKNVQILFRLGQMHYNRKQYATARSYLKQYQKSGDLLYQKETAGLLKSINTAVKS